MSPVEKAMLGVTFGLFVFIVIVGLAANITERERN